MAGGVEVTCWELRLAGLAGGASVIGWELILAAGGVILEFCLMVSIFRALVILFMARIIRAESAVSADCSNCAALFEIDWRPYVPEVPLMRWACFLILA